MGNEEVTNVGLSEVIILRKFEGEIADDAPDEEKDLAEVERITVDNGTVLSHDEYKDGELVGPVSENNLTGTDIGTFVISEENAGEVAE